MEPMSSETSAIRTQTPGNYPKRNKLRLLYSYQITHLKIGNFAFESVENFNYLGSILNADNKRHVEMAERMAKGNRSYYANAKLIKSKFLKKNTKMEIYKKMVRPVVPYSSETWTLTAKDGKT